MKTPCYQCPDRHMHCHCDCPRYAEYRAEMDKQYEERKMRFIIIDTLYRPMHKRADAWRRRKGRS